MTKPNAREWIEARAIRVGARQAVIDFLCEVHVPPQDIGAELPSRSLTERGPGSAEHGAPSGEVEAWAEVARLKSELSFEQDCLEAARRNGLTLSTELTAAREEIARLQVACASLDAERKRIRLAWRAAMDDKAASDFEERRLEEDMG